MVRFNNVSHSYKMKNKLNNVLVDVNFSVEKGQKVGIIGSNGSGKSTLLRLFGGVEEPTSGKIERMMSVSWPLAFGGAFQGSLSGLDNTRFICRVYNKHLKGAEKYMLDFTELEDFLYEPVKTYSSGMRARLAFGISMLVDFDCYLIDEITAVGDAKFQEKCNYELFEKRKDRSMLIVSHDESLIKRSCDSVIILNKGNASTHTDIDKAYLEYAEQS